MDGGSLNGVPVEICSNLDNVGSARGWDRLDRGSSVRRRHVHSCQAHDKSVSLGVFRARLLFQRLTADPGVPLDVRTAEMLGSLASLYGRPAGSGVELAVKLSQFDLADWLGMSRQRVNFAFKSLEDAGLIQLRYSAISIIDLAALEARARS
jgi:hypothetical protein